MYTEAREAAKKRAMKYVPRRVGRRNIIRGMDDVILRKFYEGDQELNAQFETDSAQGVSVSGEQADLGVATGENIGGAAVLDAPEATPAPVDAGPGAGGDFIAYSPGQDQRQQFGESGQRMLGQVSDAAFERFKSLPETHERFFTWDPQTQAEFMALMETPTEGTVAVAESQAVSAIGDAPAVAPGR